MEFKVEKDKLNPTHRNRKNGRIYVTSNVYGISGKFYDDFKIWGMNWKSPSWAKVGRRVNALINSTLKDNLKIKQVAFSVYAGCTCPCSPGFITKDVSLWGHTVYVNIQFTEDELSKIRAKVDALRAEALLEWEANPVEYDRIFDSTKIEA